MGLTIALEDECGRVKETVDDAQNLLHRLLGRVDPASYPMLASIDWYGDTVFNRVQMTRFLAEWDSVTGQSLTHEEEPLFSAVRRLALRCQDGVHNYVKFYGD